jgi:hypothetical protein
VLKDIVLLSFFPGKSTFTRFFSEKEERKKVFSAHFDHGTSLSERIKKRKRSFVNHKPDDAVDDSASYEGNGMQSFVTCHFPSPSCS